jgi:predicted DNA-binding transcriptional regulator AlpA
MKKSKPLTVVRPLFIRREDLPELTGVSISTAERLAAKGLFPSRRQLSDGTTGYLYAEVEQWAATRPLATGGLRGEATRLARKTGRAA